MCNNLKTQKYRYILLKMNLNHLYNFNDHLDRSKLIVSLRQIENLIDNLNY